MLPKLVLAGMDPTAVRVVTSMEEDPVPLIADDPVEFVAIPQPKVAEELPLTLIPVVELLPRAKTQNVPVEMILAVAWTLIVGGVLRNKLENASRCAEASLTRTTVVSPAYIPDAGGFSTLGEPVRVTLLIALIS